MYASPDRSAKVVGLNLDFPEGGLVIATLQSKGFVLKI